MVTLGLDPTFDVGGFLLRAGWRQARDWLHMEDVYYTVSGSATVKPPAEFQEIAANQFLFNQRAGN